MSLHSLCEELHSLWQAEYIKDDTSKKAAALAAQINVLRNSASPCEVSKMHKVLARHDACMALDKLLSLDWWKTEHYRELHFAMDVLADAFNTEYLKPIPIWTYGNDLLSKYNGVESTCLWIL